MVKLEIRASTCDFGGNTHLSIWASSLQNQISPDSLGHKYQWSGTGFSNIDMHQNKKKKKLEILLKQILELYPQGQQVKGDFDQCDPILFLVPGNSSFSLNVSIAHHILLSY